MKEELLQFLRQHQPMPDHPSPSEWEQFKKATLYFYSNPAEECIPLFLNAFGNWKDYEICESVQATLSQFPTKTILPYLKEALKSRQFAVKLWSADTARFFPHDSLVPHLEKLLNSTSIEVRLCVAAALEACGSKKARAVAINRLKYERDEDVIDILQSV